MKKEIKEKIVEILRENTEDLDDIWDASPIIADQILELFQQARQKERERIIIKLEKLRDDAKKYPAKYHPDLPEKSNGYNEGFNQAIRDVIEIINPLNQ